MSFLKRLFKSCFSSSDVAEVEGKSSPKPTILASPSSTVSFSSTEKSQIKASATSLVTEVVPPLGEIEIATPKLSHSTPETQEALTVVAKHTYHLTSSFPTPQIQDDDEVLIRTCAVGLNPIDWKSVDWNFCLPAFPWVTGREMSGVVEQVGKNVAGLSVGMRVWTSKSPQASVLFLRKIYLNTPKAHTTATSAPDVSSNTLSRRNTLSRVSQTISTSKPQPVSVSVVSRLQ